MTLGQPVGEPLGVSRVVAKAIGPVLDPIRVAVTALVDRIGGHAGAGDRPCGPLPCVPGLPAAVQEQHHRTAIAENIANQGVALGADKAFGTGYAGHGRSRRKASTPFL